MAKQKTPKPKIVQFKFDYVTSTASLLVVGGQGDGIVVQVVNDSGASANTRAVIYHNTGAGAIVAADSGNAVVAPNWQWGLGFTVHESGEYWVRVQASSEFLIHARLACRAQRIVHRLPANDWGHRLRNPYSSRATGDRVHHMDDDHVHLDGAIELIRRECAIHAQVAMRQEWP
ncbi:MAG TPA: hypothetical protein VFC46_00745 [Humisphaera sp.]|nr:hypothetical protein [Humisphaera sp.]